MLWDCHEPGGFLIEIAKRQLAIQKVNRVFNRFG